MEESSSVIIKKPDDGTSSEHDNTDNKSLETATADWNTLPKPVITNIYSFLNVEDTLAASGAFHKWRKISFAPTVWNNKAYSSREEALRPLRLKYLFKELNPYEDIAKATCPPTMKKITSGYQKANASLYNDLFDAAEARNIKIDLHARNWLLANQDSLVHFQLLASKDTVSEFDSKIESLTGAGEEDILMKREKHEFPGGMKCTTRGRICDTSYEHRLYAILPTKVDELFLYLEKLQEIGEELPIILISQSHLKECEKEFSNDGKDMAKFERYKKHLDIKIVDINENNILEVYTNALSDYVDALEEKIEHAPFAISSSCTIL